MDIPKKRKSNGNSPNRSQRRAAQRNGVNGDASGGVEETKQYVPAPPAGMCVAWHYYWCDNHQDWHHHAESAVDAIAESLTPS